MRGSVIWLLVTTACIGAAPGAEPRSSDSSLPPVTTPDDAIPITVIRVTDGDSLLAEMGGIRIELRLMGINAPERDECMGVAAGEALQEWVNRSEMSAVMMGTDQYDRALAYLFVDGVFVNLAMVRSGNALGFSQGGPQTPALLEAEAIARGEGMGIWNRSACGDDQSVNVSVEIVEANPPGPDDEHLDLEVVAITTEQDIDLSGYVLRDESSVNRLVLPEGTFLAAGSRLEIGSGCTTVTDWCQETSIWNNSGDAAILVAPNGAMVAIDRYFP